MATQALPNKKVKGAAKRIRMSFINVLSAFTHSSTPPTPIAKAPIAKGLISGANCAAVPVVPHKKLAIMIAKAPLNESFALIFLTTTLISLRFFFYCQGPIKFYLSTHPSY